MSKVFDIKRETSLREPLDIVDGETTYQVLELTDELMEEVTAVEDEELPLGEVLNRQIGIFTGQAAENFAHLSIREKVGIRQFILGSLNDPLGNRQQRRAAKR